MATTYSWSVDSLERRVSDGLVKTVHYRVGATDGTHTSGAYGSVELEGGSVVVPYEDLTEEVVIEWVKAKLGGDEAVAQVETALQADIAKKAAPVMASGTPWS